MGDDSTLSFRMPSRGELDLLHLQSELRLLEDHLDFICAEVERQTVQREQQLQKALRDLAVSEDDSLEWRRAAHSERIDRQKLHDEFVNESLPRMLVHPFVLSLWSFYEFVTKDLAERVRRNEEIELRFKDINRHYYIDGIEKYFDHVIHFPTGFEKPFEGERVGVWLERIAKLRNQIAHGPGSSEGVDVKISEIEGIEEAKHAHRIGGMPSIFVLDCNFAERALRVVEKNLNFLTDQYDELLDQADGQ